MRVVWDKALPVFDCEYPMAPAIESGVNVFRLRVPLIGVPVVHALIAVIDPEGWRLEARVIYVAPMADGEGMILLYLQPYSAHADYKPVALRGQFVDGEWEPLA